MEKTRRLIGDNIRKLETAKGKVIDDNTNLLEEGILDSISMMSIIEFLEELAQVEIQSPNPGRSSHRAKNQS